MIPVELTAEFRAAHDEFAGTRVWRSIAVGPGWITDGIAAIHVGREAAELILGPRVDQATVAATQQFRSWILGPTTPVTFDAAAPDNRPYYVTPPADRPPPCADCKGDGTIDCDAGFEHECSACEGLGKVDPPGRKRDDPGRRSYIAADGKRHLLADWMAALLLAGKTTVRFDEPGLLSGGVHAIGGKDAEGDIVVVVMGMRP